MEASFPLPSFDGDGDVDEWLFKVQALFDYTGKREDALMVLYASNFLTGKAHAEWRNAVEKGQPVNSWPEFKAFLDHCFKPQSARVETEQDKVNNFLAALTESDPCAAQYAKGKKPNSVRDVQALVKEFNTPEEKTCFVCYVGNDYGIWLRGKVKGQAVSMQFSNNSDNFISEKAVKRLGLEAVRCKPFVMGSLVAGGDDAKVWNTKVAGLEVEIEGGLKLRMDYAVVHLARHDFIVGRELIHACKRNVVFNWGGESPSIELQMGGKVYRCTLHQGRP